MPQRKLDGLLRALLIWTAVTMLAVWLPLVRGLMDGSSYQWAWSPYISGSGISGDYWLVVCVAVFGLAVLLTGWRGARKPFHWPLLQWHFPLGDLTLWAGFAGCASLLLG